jgi:translation initiation factor IF-3
MIQMTSGIHQQIHEKAIMITDPAGREVHVIEDRAALKIACQYSVSLQEIYIEALRLLVYPYRYIRNRLLLSVREDWAGRS